MATTFNPPPCWLCGLASLTALLIPMCAQNTSPDPIAAGAGSPAATTSPTPSSPAPPDKRVFGLVPNYKTTDLSLPFKPITPRQKFTIAAKDSFDWTIPILAAAYAGIGQWTNQNPRLGQGASGYGNRFVRVYADQVIGNFMVEGCLPTLLHEDPRYFRMGQGSFWKRTGYAASRVFVTRTDRGTWRFNTSEVLGNAIAVGISNSYYPGSRTLSDNSQRFATQIGTDAFSNILKEFWPDVRHKFFNHSPK